MASNHHIGGSNPSGGATIEVDKMEDIEEEIEKKTIEGWVYDCDCGRTLEDTNPDRLKSNVKQHRKSKLHKKYLED